MKTSKQLKGMVKAFFCICQNTVSSLFSDEVDSFPSQNHQKLRMNIWFRTSLHGGNVMSVMMTWNERSENITNTKRHENDSVTVRQAEHSFYLTFFKKLMLLHFVILVIWFDCSAGIIEKTVIGYMISVISKQAKNFHHFSQLDEIATFSKTHLNFKRTKTFTRHSRHLSVPDPDLQDDHWSTKRMLN